VNVMFPGINYDVVEYFGMTKVERMVDDIVALNKNIDCCLLDR